MKMKRSVPALTGVQQSFSCPPGQLSAACPGAATEKGPKGGQRQKQN